MSTSPAVPDAPRQVERRPERRASAAAGLAPAASDRSTLATLAMVVVAIAALYFGRDVLVPVALAALIAFALEPVATRLRRWGLGRVLSVLVVVGMALVVFAGIGYVVGRQVMQLAENLPLYQANIGRKIHALQGASPSQSVFGRASAALHELGAEISAPAPGAASAPRPSTTTTRDPVAVRVVSPEATPFEIIRDVAGPVLGPIGVAGLVFVFLVFMLLEQEDMRDRLIRLVGGRDLNVTTQALAEATHRVSRYLLMQLMVNATYGVPIGLGLYLIGVPNALLWGLLAVLLRFVPYVGPFIAALFPIALALAVDPGWNMLLWTLGLFLVVELVSNNVIEPWLYGASTGLSTVAIILAAIFWTTLWGPVGLLLSTPLTVCLVVLGRYVPQLQFLHVMLGSAPALTPAERFYQRMLASDAEEGADMAAPYLEADDLAGFHREVVVPALLLAEADRRQGTLSNERVPAVASSVERALASVAEPETESDAPTDPTPAPVIWGGVAAYCVGARTPLDTAAAALLSQQLERRGVPARAVDHDGWAQAAADRAALEAVMVVIVVALGSREEVAARQPARRVRRSFAGHLVLCALGNAQPASAEQREALRVDAVVQSIEEAAGSVEAMARAPLETAMTPAPIPLEEPARLAALERLHLLDTPSEERFDWITRDLRQAFQAPIALLTLVDSKRQFWKSALGLPEVLARAREAPRETSVCGHVVAENEMVVVDDLLRDPRFANNPLLRAHGIRFYAGAPLRTPEGWAIGSLCVMDTRPRTMTDTERALLQMAADQVMREIAAGERAKPPPAAPDAPPAQSAQTLQTSQTSHAAPAGPGQAAPAAP